MNNLDQMYSSQVYAQERVNNLPYEQSSLNNSHEDQNNVTPTMMQRLFPWLLQSERKPPKGFEKFFKKKEQSSASKASGKEFVYKSLAFLFFKVFCYLSFLQQLVILELTQFQMHACRILRQVDLTIEFCWFYLKNDVVIIAVMQTRRRQLILREMRSNLIRSLKIESKKKKKRRRSTKAMTRKLATRSKLTTALSGRSSCLMRTTTQSQRDSQQ